MLPAVNQANQEQPNTGDNTKQTQQPNEQRGRIFIAGQNQGDKQCSNRYQEIRQAFVYGFRQTHDLSPQFA
jgi:hypothetical protein